MIGHRKQPAGRGFTLLELILIMIVLCTVLALAAPSLRGFFSSRQIDDMSRQILAMTRYAKTQAVFEARNYRIYFDRPNRRYWIASLRDSQYRRLDNNFGSLFTVPADISLSFYDMDFENGVYYFAFTPEGYSKEAALRLEDAQGTTQEVICYGPAEPYEIVEIINGTRRYEEEKKNLR